LLFDSEKKIFEHKSDGELFASLSSAKALRTSLCIFFLTNLSQASLFSLSDEAMIPTFFLRKRGNQPTHIYGRCVMSSIYHLCVATSFDDIASS